MSNFECKVSELNGNGNLNEIHADKKDPLSSNGINNSSFETNTIGDKSTSPGSNNSSYIGKILTEKNLKMIVLITVFYLFLHSEQVLEFVNVRIPSLGSNLVLNVFGKIIFGLLMGFFFIGYSFFFQGL